MAGTVTDLNERIGIGMEEACARYCAQERGGSYFDAASPVIVITQHRQEQDAAAYIKNFFQGRTRQNRGFYFLAMQENGGEGAICDRDGNSIKESLREAIKTIVADVGVNGGAFVDVTRISVCMVFDARDSGALRYAQLETYVRELLPRLYAPEFYLFVTYNELGYDTASLSQTMALLKNIEKYHKNGGGATVAAMGMKKQNSRTDSLEAAYRSRMDAICLAIMGIASKSFTLCPKGGVCALGAVSRSRYVRDVWMMLFYALAERMTELFRHPQEREDNKAESGIDAILKSVEGQIDVSFMRYALMCPIGPTALDRRLLSEVEETAFGGSLRYYYDEMEKLVRKEQIEKTSHYMEHELEQICSDRERCQRFLNKIDQLNVGLDCAVNINYGMAFTQNLNFDEEQVRSFIISNIYEPMARAAENRIKKDILLKIKDGISRFEIKRDSAEQLWQEIRDAAADVRAREAGLGLMNTLYLEDALLHIQSDFAGLEGYGVGDVAEALIREAGKLLTRENVYAAMSAEANFSRICKDMEERMSPYCSDLSDHTDTLALLGEEEETEQWRRLNRRPDGNMRYESSGGVHDLWAVACREIDLNMLTCVVLMEDCEYEQKEE